MQLIFPSHSPRLSPVSSSRAFNGTWKGNPGSAQRGVVVLAGRSVRDSHQRRRRLERGLDEWTCFDKTPELLPRLAARLLSRCRAHSISFLRVFELRAFINNLFINMPGNAGGRWSEDGGRMEGGERKGEEGENARRMLELKGPTSGSAGGGRVLLSFSFFFNPCYWERRIESE